MFVVSMGCGNGRICFIMKFRLKSGNKLPLKRPYGNGCVHFVFDASLVDPRYMKLADNKVSHQILDEIDLIQPHKPVVAKTAPYLTL